MNAEILEVMESYNGYLNKISEGCISIAEYLRNNNIEEALKLILYFSEGVNWLCEVNEKLRSVGINNPLQIDKIHDFLNEINEGLEIQDYIIVADIFEYEIKDFFENATRYVTQ
jgi:hypothetical protein